VRTIRHASNVGPIRNFNSLLAELRGDYVMLLADDDALEPTFVERCLDSFAERPDFALVHGRTHYVSESREAFGRDFDVTEPDPGRRVCRYPSQVFDNGAFYGLVRGDAMRAALPIPSMLAGDWVWGARLVFQGGLRFRDDTQLMRSYGGASTSFEAHRRGDGAATPRGDASDRAHHRRCVPRYPVWVPGLRRARWARTTAARSAGCSRAAASAWR